MTDVFNVAAPRQPHDDAVGELIPQVEMIVALPSVMDDDSQPLLIRRACLEAFLLAARAMSHFLGCVEGQRRADDMFATSFVSHWKPPPESSSRLRKLVAEVDKQIAHYTILR